MPSRRSFLIAGSVAAGAALAGCSAVAGPPGVDATFRASAVDVPDAESAPVVARAAARSGEHGCPEGLLRAETRVHEARRPDGGSELVLVTEYDVITGESGCASGWGQTGIAARHDWRAGAASEGSVATRQSEAVPVGGDRPRQATLEERHAEGVADWRVHLTPPTKSTRTYRFASAFVVPEAPTDGDVLATARGRSRVRKGWVGGDDTLAAEATLTYGETDE